MEFEELEEVRSEEDEDESGGVEIEEREGDVETDEGNEEFDDAVVLELI